MLKISSNMEHRQGISLAFYQIFVYNTLKFMFISKEKCKPLEIEVEEEIKTESKATPTNAAPKNEKPSKPQGALAAAARQVSRGSLLGGGGEGKPSMASTVLAMASKATSSSAAPSTATAPSAPPSKPSQPAPPPSTAKSPAAPLPPATSKPSTSGTATSSTAATAKQETPTVNNLRSRHDSQGRLKLNRGTKFFRYYIQHYHHH